MSRSFGSFLSCIISDQWPLSTVYGLPTGYKEFLNKTEIIHIRKQNHIPETTVNMQWCSSENFLTKVTFAVSFGEIACKISNTLTWPRIWVKFIVSSRNEESVNPNYVSSFESKYCLQNETHWTGMKWLKHQPTNFIWHLFIVKWLNETIKHSTLEFTNSFFT